VDSVGSSVTEPIPTTLGDVSQNSFEILGRSDDDAVFVSRIGTPFTRFGVYHLTLKANAVALCEVGQPRPARSWKEDKDLMAFLKSL